MNGGRQAFGLLSRCRQALRPVLTSRSALVNRCSAAECHRRTYSDQKVDDNNDSYPKLPVEAPFHFANDMIKRTFSQLQWCHSELGMEKEQVLSVNEAAEKVNVFLCCLLSTTLWINSEICSVIVFVA